MRTLIALILILSSFSARSAIINAASVSRADVVAAINSGTYQDTIMIPAGSATYSSGIVLTKAMNIIGAGMDQTFITGGFSGASAIFEYDPDVTSINNNYPFHISGLNLELSSGCRGIKIGSDSANIASFSMLVSSNRFRNSPGSTRAFKVGGRGTIYGVAWSNQWINCNLATESAGSEDDSWDNFLITYGDTNNFYFEDNYFEGNTFFHEGGQGGRYAARFNTYLYDVGAFETIFDQHGNQGSGVRATMVCEVYYNTIILTNSANGRLLDHRGGNLLMFYNTITGPGTVSSQNREENPDTPTANIMPQHVTNSYYFRNLVGGVHQNVPNAQDLVPEVIVEDEEFWNEQVGFDGSSGVGFGLLSARPASPTLAGVAYWATDQGDWNTLGDDGVLYKWNGSSWEEMYEPLTYPHPLRNFDVAASSECDLLTVSNAIFLASAGDTITVPEGSCTWDATLTITKAITLEGAGWDKTTIISGALLTNGVPLILYDPDSNSISANLPFIVRGFTFDMNTTGDGIHYRCDSNMLALSSMIVNSNVFLNGGGNKKSSGSLAGTVIKTGSLSSSEEGYIHGLIYHNRFTNCNSISMIYGGDTVWDNFTFVYGTTNAMYFEDNIFHGNSAFHFGGHGGTYVCRSNLYVFTTGSFEVVWDVHGNQAGGVWPTYGVEFYRNRIQLARTTTTLDHRGGPGLVFQNTETGSSGTWQVRNEATTNTSGTATSNPIPQNVSDTYYFLNTDDGVDQPVTENGDVGDEIAEDVEYFQYDAAFDGSSGVGAGVLADRPASASLLNAGYWATDQGDWNTLGEDGILYIWNGSAWEEHYEPLQYPHPYRTGTLAKPTAPTGVLFTIGL